MEPSDLPQRASHAAHADDGDKTAAAKRAERVLECTPLFASLLAKFEASFVSEAPLIKRVLAARVYPNLTDIKVRRKFSFINKQCF